MQNTILTCLQMYHCVNNPPLELGIQSGRVANWPQAKIVYGNKILVRGMLYERETFIIHYYIVLWYVCAIITLIHSLEPGFTLSTCTFSGYSFYQL